MKMKIEIKMDSAAFHNHDEFLAEPELTRIFEGLVRKMHNGAKIGELEEQRIRDVNGNVCGNVKIDKT